MEVEARTTQPYLPTYLSSACKVTTQSQSVPKSIRRHAFRIICFFLGLKMDGNEDYEYRSLALQHTGTYEI